MSEIVKFIKAELKNLTESERNKIIEDACFSERQEQIFVLKHIRRKSLISIADEINFSESVVKSELRTIRNKIEKILTAF